MFSQQEPDSEKWKLVLLPTMDHSVLNLVSISSPAHKFNFQNTSLA